MLISSIGADILMPGLVPRMKTIHSNKNNTQISLYTVFFITIVLCLTVILLPYAPKTFAHAFVINSDPSTSQSLPTPPSRVDVYFSEPVDSRYSKLTVLDSNGKQIDNKNTHHINNNDQTALTITLPGGIKDGVYTVTSKVLSQTDGHVTENAFLFGIAQHQYRQI
jgi:copper transport protein